MKGIEVESKSKLGNTILINASNYGHIEIIEILLNHGAKIESTNNRDITPLYFSCQEGHLPVVNLLINKGANIGANCNDGWRPLHIASWYGHLAIVKALIEKGFVKMGNFSHNQKKLDYAYLLTPSGIKSKAVLTAHFLERKAAEYAMLKSELEKYEKDSKHL
jgi:ankyrin repeat protein